MTQIFYERGARGPRKHMILRMEKQQQYPTALFDPILIIWREIYGRGGEVAADWLRFRGPRNLPSARSLNVFEKWTNFLCSVLGYYFYWHFPFELDNMTLT